MNDEMIEQDIEVLKIKHLSQTMNFIYGSLSSDKKENTEESENKEKS
jgi:hypothetical protein